jgi:hypothetical protein
MESIDYINNRIQKEICYDTINKLKDEYLINEYKESQSVKYKKNEIVEILGKLLSKYNVDNKDLFINDFLLEYYVKLIPAGTKGSIRGNKFNCIVKKTIQNLKLDKKRFEVCFEKKCNLYITSEIPDWYILEKSTGKLLIGMNQLDLWGGGQQINRGFKYLIDNKDKSNNCKILCVICNEIKFSSNKNKAYNLFKVGFQNNTLCYLKNIEDIIYKYFN